LRFPSSSQNKLFILTKQNDNLREEILIHKGSFFMKRLFATYHFFIICVLIILAFNSVFGQKQNQARPSLLWTYNAPNVVRIGSPAKIGVDGMDNGYILSNPQTGETEAPPHVQVMKVSTTGSQVYGLIFDGGSGRAIKADVAGFAYLLWGNSVSKVNQAGNSFIYHQMPTGMNESFGLAIDAGTNLYVAGQLNGDAAVSKLDANGNVVWVQTIGGISDDIAFGIALDGANNIWVTGRTTSSNFPILNAFQPALGGNSDAFVAKFDSNGNRTFSSYLGGLENDQGLTIVADRFGNAHIGGDSSSGNFPILNPVQANYKGMTDGFVSQVSPTGTLMYSTFLGGTGFDQVEAIEVDFQTATYVTGKTYSSDFPLVRSIQTTLQGNWQAFLTKVNQNGSGFEYSTYQSGGPNYFYEGQGLALDSQGNLLMSISYNVYASGGDGRTLLQKFSKK
jgi:hypothetical protein